MFNPEEEDISLQSIITKRKKMCRQRKVARRKLKVKIKLPKSRIAQKMQLASDTKRNKNGNSIFGFSRKLKPERIIGAMESLGEIMLLIKWNGINEADLVSSQEANIHCPQLVIKYYEDHMIWKTPINGNKWK